MAVVMLVNYHQPPSSIVAVQNPKIKSGRINPNTWSFRRRPIANCSNGNTQSDPNSPQDKETNSLGVKAALSMLKFYKREISPLMPKSCRYVPSCSEYSMQAYKKYGVAKGTILTAWRLCRCNPFGGSGYDPPIWFDDTRMPPEE